MSNDLTADIVRTPNPAGAIGGTGFIITDGTDLSVYG